MTTASEAVIIPVIMAQAALKVVIGLGATGLSCVRYCQRKGFPVAVMDSRLQPPGLTELQQNFPDVEVVLGGFSTALLARAAELIVSPGVSLQEPAIAAQIAAGTPAIGDIELFAREVQKPVIAITGSNGKTTLTSLLGLMITAAGFKAAVCGNIGTPVLDMLAQEQPDYYVLELSSFQLETTYSLAPVTAVMLNISPDHMDRYAQYADYVAAKQRIYQHCMQPVVNFDERHDWCDLTFISPPIGFSVQEPVEQQFGLHCEQGVTYLARGSERLMPTSKMKLQGQHHDQNALAALALGSVIGLPMPGMLSVLQEFQGLAHRCQWISEWHGIVWYNDSKATNIGAAIAAIHSLSPQVRGRIILIAGGDGKAADFSALRQPVAAHIDQVILLGQDAPALAKTLAGAATITRVKSMQEAVSAAAELATAGDAVLLSPACASFDMFKNYQERGDVFSSCVHQLSEQS